MKGKEDLFSRQQFICVCVFVPPSSVLHISQLCVELKGVESTLSAPISSLRFVPPPPPYTHTCTHTNLSPSRSLTLFLSLDLSPSLLPSFPPPLKRIVPRSQHSSLCLNCEHHNRTNDVLLLCHTSTLCPLVLLLSNRPGWRFFEGGWFISCAWLWMTGMHVEKDKESEKQRKRDRIGS